MLFLDLITPRSLWILVGGELLAGVAAGLVFNALRLGEDEPTTATLDEQAGLAPQAEPGA
jgi:hypothetical protein